jgi:uncharacterized protein YdiU (UPF0061 family)
VWFCTWRYEYRQYVYFRLTIDYGPYGWLEDYNPKWTPNTTDRENRRYRLGTNRNSLMEFVSLANALYPLVDEAAPLEKILEDFQLSYQKDYHTMMLSKLGLNSNKDKDDQLIAILTDNLQLTETDMTIFFRNLSQLNKEDDEETALAIVLIHLQT